jgi:hypothetical protein
MDCLVALRPELKLDLAAHPGQRWEGRIDLTDSGKLFNLDLILTLHFSGGLFEGNGNLTDRESGAHIDISLSGQFEGANAWFDLWIDAGTGFGLRIDCTGEIDAGVTAFEGQCSYVCGQPDKCACEGGSGPISLRKIGAA